MRRAQCVLVVALCVGLAHSWDFALTAGDRLEFYTHNSYGTKIETVRLSSQNLTALAYDEVHNMLLYVDNKKNNDAICGYNMTSSQYKCYVERNGRNIHGLAFDPVTETLFFTDITERSINTFSFKHGSKNNVYGNLLIELDDGIPADIAVDSCRGYVYWINLHEPKSTIERARLDGSGREVLFYIQRGGDPPYLNDIHSLAIDQQIQQMIWSMSWSSIKTYIYSADLNGKNGKRIITWGTDVYNMYPNTHAFSKDYVYMVIEPTLAVKTIYKYSKQSYLRYKITNVHTASVVAIAANYKMEDQFQGISECSHVFNNFCVHGTKVKGQFLCKCTPGYTGDSCEVSVCKNYCSNGNCSVTEQGLPKCRCQGGYSGERCEVNVCNGYCSNNGTCSLDDDSQPVCQCQGDYVGHRCEIPAGCLNYCLKGNCSYTEQGLPTCRCEAGYSGERCEVDVCNEHCVNNGTCFLNKEDEPICDCVGDYMGRRCEISSGCLNYCLKGNCSYTDQGLPTCRCEAGYSGERCEVDVCNEHCVNNGTCFLNKEDEPICDCVGDYVGRRCEISSGCLNYCLKGNCSYTDQGLPTCRCEAGYSGERCEVDVCNEHCVNNGTCSLNEEDEPICDCVGEYEGDRCEVTKALNNDCGSLHNEKQPVCQCVGSHEDSGRETDRKQTITSTSTSHDLDETEKSLTLGDLLQNWCQHNSIHSSTCNCQ